jgi:hypothetical protein
MGEGRAIEIEHGGRVYQLRITQLNKLILTAQRRRPTFPLVASRFCQPEFPFFQERYMALDRTTLFSWRRQPVPIPS